MQCEVSELRARTWCYELQRWRLCLRCATIPICECACVRLRRAAAAACDYRQGFYLRERKVGNTQSADVSKMTRYRLLWQPFA